MVFVPSDLMSICTPAQYRKHTGDAVNYDGDVVDSLAAAQQDLERLTDRKFEKIERTETLPVLNGQVWPSAYPLFSVSAPVDAQAHQVSISVAAQDAWSGWGQQWAAVPSPQVTTQDVTYIGGFDPMPTELQRIVAAMALELMVPLTPAAEPTAVTAEDIDGRLQPALVLTEVTYSAAILRKIRPWRHIRSRLV